MKYFLGLAPSRNLINTNVSGDEAQTRQKSISESELNTLPFIYAD